MATMNISLPDKLKSYVDNRVESDGYGTASEYVRELIRQDQQRKEQEQLERAQLEKMRKDVQAGLDALKAGRFTEYDSAGALINDIRAEGVKRLARSKQGGKGKKSGRRR
jgi:antitoxin ParD1/3/4